jgi:hypothetical protein
MTAQTTTAADWQPTAAAAIFVKLGRDTAASAREFTRASTIW